MGGGEVASSNVAYNLRVAGGEGLHTAKNAGGGVFCVGIEEEEEEEEEEGPTSRGNVYVCLLYTSPSPRD